MNKINVKQKHAFHKPESVFLFTLLMPNVINILVINQQSIAVFKV